MAHEEKVLEVLELLKKAKVERKKIEKEIEKLDEQYKGQEKQDYAELDALKAEIFKNKFVEHKQFGTKTITVSVGPYDSIDIDREVELYTYSFLGIILEGTWDDGYHKSASSKKLRNTYYDEFSDMSEEDVIKLITSELEKSIDVLKKREEELENKVFSIEERIASLEAELSITPEIRVLTRARLKAEIQKARAEAMKAKANLDECKEEIAKVASSEYKETYVKERLDAFNQIKQRMEVYFTREIELDDKYSRLKEREFNTKKYELKNFLSAAQDKEKEIIKSLMSSDSVAVLVKITKDPKFDEETREMVKKVLKLIADQRKENTNKR